MLAGTSVDDLIGSDAMDRDEARIGEVSQVYLNPETDEPVWASVRLGLLNNAEVLVPLEDAEFHGQALHVPVERRVARDAPRIEIDEPLTDREQERLFTHYGIPTPRHPRNVDEMLEVADGDVCYSIKADAA